MAMTAAHWPSIQHDSEILRRRIAPVLRARYLKRAMRLYLERYERRVV